EPSEPSLVHIGHARLLRRFLDRVAGLLLRAHEQNRSAASGDAGGEVLRVLQQPLGLLEVDDVDPVALAEDEAAHLRVPAPGLVPEVNACLEQVRDRYVRHTTPFSVWTAPVGLCGPEAIRLGRAALGRTGSLIGEEGYESPRKAEGRSEDRPPAHICSVPVWPFGDWLPCSCLERAEQVHGQFG